jgi:hypothetical protein
MFPASRSGNINTFAFPATALPGAFLTAISLTMAASTWNSPSIAMSGARLLAILVAIQTAC